MSEKNKCILHAIDTTGPGGAEMVFLDLVEKLTPNGYQNYAIIKGSGWVEDQLKRRNIPYLIIKPRGFLSLPYYWELITTLRKKNTQLIHAHLLGSTLTYSIIGMLLRIPVVATLHGRVDVNPSERFVSIKNSIMKLGVSKLIAVSNDLASYIEQRNLFNKKNIQVIYNGIEENRYGKSELKDLRNLIKAPPDAYLVGSLGNVRPAKNYETLIEAAAHLINDSKLNLHFVIAGHQKADLMSQLQRQIEKHSLEGKIHFIGFHQNTAEFLGQLDFFALSSSSEGFSIATIEAMATALPVVATRCGGPEEIIEHEKTGLLVPINNPTELALGIKRLIENPELRECISREGKNHVRSTFSFKLMLESYTQVYHKFLKEC